MDMGRSGRLNGVLRHVATAPILRRSLFFLVQINPRFGRWAISKTGFNPGLVDQLVLGRAPPQWLIEPAPAATAEWLALLGDEPASAG